MGIVRESIMLEGKKDKLALSAGLVIIQDNEILLVHPTGSPWYGSYSIPKGHVEAGEEIIDAAKRETKEEIGISPEQLNIADNPQEFIDYTDKKGKVYKRVYYYIATPKEPLSKKDFKLQKKEVDWAGFIGKKEAQKKIFGRFKKLLDYLK